MALQDIDMMNKALKLVEVKREVREMKVDDLRGRLYTHLIFPSVRHKPIIEGMQYPYHKSAEENQQDRR
jgi:hypothetical protein